MLNGLKKAMLSLCAGKKWKNLTLKLSQTVVAANKNIFAFLLICLLFFLLEPDLCTVILGGFTIGMCVVLIRNQLRK
jgi:hypothetical protein